MLTFRALAVRQSESNQETIKLAVLALFELKFSYALSESLHGDDFHDKRSILALSHMITISHSLSINFELSSTPTFVCSSLKSEEFQIFVSLRGAVDRVIQIKKKGFL